MRLDLVRLGVEGEQVAEVAHLRERPRVLDLDLDDGAQSLSCHLDGETGIATASSLPESLSQKKPRWTATVLEDRVSLRLEIGPWQLRGAGERDADGLRCAAFSGSVTEGDEDAADSAERVAAEVRLRHAGVSSVCVCGGV